MYESKEPYVPIFPAFDFVRLPLKRRGSTPVIQVRRDRPGVMPVFLFWASRKASKATAKQKRLQRSKPSTTAQDRDRADWAGQSSSHRPWWWSGARWVRQWSEGLLQCRQGEPCAKVQSATKAINPNDEDLLDLLDFFQF